MARYRFYDDPNHKAGHRTICVSSYAGRKIRGVAICTENDNFDSAKGEALAQARVDLEIAFRRMARARAKLNEAWELIEAAEAYKDRMESYVDDSADALEDAKNHLTELLKEM